MAQKSNDPVENEIILTGYVKEFLADLAITLKASEYAQVLRKIGLLKNLGMALGEPHASPVEGKLWELKARAGKRWIRIFYCEQGLQKFVLLHAIEKKSNKLKRNDIEIAQKRMMNFG